MHSSSAKLGSPTYQLTHCTTDPTMQWYYEVEVITTEYIRVGWARPSYKPDPQRGKGVGDDVDSFSFAG